MRFDWSSCAVGVIAGVGAILCVIFAVQLDIFVDTPVCAGDENGLTCARGWINAIAVIAAAGTVFFLAREQSFARRNRLEDRALQLELLAFETLEVRATVARMAPLAKRISMHNQKLTNFIWAEPVQERPVEDCRSVFYTLRRVRQILGFRIWKDINRIDGTFDDERRALRNSLETFFEAFATEENSGAVFLETGRIRYVEAEALGPDDEFLRDLAKRVSALADRCAELGRAAETSSFREYFRVFASGERSDPD